MIEAAGLLDSLVLRLGGRSWIARQFSLAPDSLAAQLEYERGLSPSSVVGQRVAPWPTTAATASPTLLRANNLSKGRNESSQTHQPPGRSAGGAAGRVVGRRLRRRQQQQWNRRARSAEGPPDGKAATIGEASTSLGKILVDAQGRTIYLFQKDSGTKSTCSGACAVAWPPVRSSGKPTVGSGLTASKVGTTPRSDGKPQVTYNGHPLYLFQEDQNAGDTNGQGVNGFGAPWYVMSPAGDAITTSAATSSASAGGGGSSGY